VEQGFAKTMFDLKPLDRVLVGLGDTTNLLSSLVVLIHANQPSSYPSKPSTDRPAPEAASTPIVSQYLPMSDSK
jgi:hypothetical protein